MHKRGSCTTVAAGQQPVSVGYRLPQLRSLHGLLAPPRTSAFTEVASVGRLFSRTSGISGRARRPRRSALAALAFKGPTMAPQGAQPSGPATNNNTNSNSPVQLITSDFLAAALSNCDLLCSAPSSSPDCAAIQQPMGQQCSSSIPKSSTFLIVLNWKLPKCLPQLWNAAGHRLCADGGANRLYEEVPAMLQDQDQASVRDKFQPNMILGDLDSMRPDVRDFYLARGVPIQGSTDQETTDLTKCILHIERHLVSMRANRSGAVQAVQVAGSTGSGGAGHNGATAAAAEVQESTDDAETGARAVAASEAKQSAGTKGAHTEPEQQGVSGARGNGAGSHAQHSQSQQQGPGGPATLADGLGAGEVQLEEHDHLIVVLGALGGRLDHTLANLNTMHMFRHLNIALLGEGNLVRLVRKGRTLIRPVRPLEGPTCGLIPIAGPATGTTRGMRWDLDNTHMHVGGLVSSSNILESDEIWVESDGDLVWTTQVNACA